MKKTTYLIVLLFAVFMTQMGYSQVKNDFDPRYNDNLRGDLTIIANNIVNRNGDEGYWTGPWWNRRWVSVPRTPNDPYNETGNSSSANDNWDMQYIDIDGDASTFSSSSSTLTVPDASCSRVRYAGLYWSAVYVNSDRSAIDDIKFRVPGGAYQDITADEILFDGDGDTDFGYYSPYACYKDITSIVAGLADPNGDYFVANINASSGSSISGGVSGGWTMVVVYENPNMPGKYITTFDGYAGIKSGETLDFPVNGFTTLPAPFPVNARLGVSTLEGDNRISGDGLSIRANSNATFTPLGNTVNPTNNFFNANITIENTIVNTRNPNSINTLGWDADLFTIANALNAVIPNDETGAVLRASSSQDKYDIFFGSFDVEIIEPIMNLAKTVEDIGGNDITGQGVNLGQVLDYVLTFQNVGNDDGDNYTIRDVLPVNVTLDETNLTLPPGVTYTFDAATRTVVFSIPNNLVEENDPSYSIRMRVRVAENCFDFINACSDVIQNLAYSTYRGVINNNEITDDPSVTDFDNCGFTTPGATNFLLDDLENCDFSRTVQLCGATILLDSGDGFDDYIWYRDVNGNRVIDASDIVLNDGNPDNDLSTLIVDEEGVYIVDKIVADPCKGFQEIITVEQFGSAQNNPISALINDTSNTVEGEITICPVDGDPLPKIFLCGLNDTEAITVNIPDAISIEWEQLDESSCTASVEDCANKNGTCSWGNVAYGDTFVASDPGQYRLIVHLQNGCFSRFYFNVFKNPLDPQYNSRDIICATPGNITVTNMPADYEYQLLDATNGNVLVPYSDNNGPVFSIANNGAYTVEMRQQGVVDGCIFMLEDIGIRARDYQVDITTRDTDCNGMGEITISATDVEPQYYYEISQNGTTVDTFGPDDDNNYTFENLNDGVYDVLVTTDDGCSYTEQVTINDLSDLELEARVSQHITCREGNIQMDSSGGQTPYSYAIWSFVDEGGNVVTSYPSVNDIPASEYQTSVIFDILNPGDYTFVMVDRNNCSTISNTVTIVLEPSVDYTTTMADESCFGLEDGSFVINMISTNGYKIDYVLTMPDGSFVNNTSGNFQNLAQGDYTVTLVQTKGGSTCEFVETFTIGGPVDSVTGTALLTQDYTCLQEGIIEVQNVTGGVAPYEYSIDGVNFVSGAGAETFSNLTNGSYTITIRDDSGCTFLTNEITIDPLNQPTDLTFTATAPNCPTQTSDVTATVVNGNAPFVFEIIAPSAIASTSAAGSTANFDGLSPDTYTFRVTDAKGCTYEESYTIAPIAPITVSGSLISNISCFNDTDGEATFTVSGFATSYDYTITGPSNSNGTAETNGTIALTNLDDGTYTITVTDTDSNCTATTDVTINAPAAALTLTVGETQPSCTADGAVVLTASGGWGSNNFTITYPDGTTTFTSTTGSFGSLDQDGTYNVSVEDANGCIVTDSFVLNDAIAPTLQIVANDICYDDAVGLTLTANVTAGGNGNYEYRLNGGAYVTGNVFVGLTPGTHTIEVIDGNNCTDTASITINPELSVTAAASNITACATDTDVTVTAAGGDGSYVYAIVADGVTPSAGDFATTNPVSVTGAGDYDVYVRDNGGALGYCEASFDITIAQDAPITITPTVTDVTCFGSADGSIALAVTDGAAPYQYSIDNGATYQTTANFSGLSAATYAVRVRDANGCEETASLQVNQPNQIIAEATQTQDYTCLQDGEITVGSITPTTGGSGDYQYSINGSVWTPSTTGGAVFTNITDGTYTVQVRDANNISCIITLADIVVDPLPTAPTLTSTVAYNCDGSGNITILPNDASYTYAIDGNPAQAGNVFNNIAVGLHNIVVNYGPDCTVDIDVNVEAGNTFAANITSFDNLDCNADNTGSITFEVENFDAVTGFEYSVNGGAYIVSMVSPVSISGLAAGNNTINVRDVNDNTCAIPLAQNLTEPAVLVTSASITTEFMCSNTGATITASAIGGTPVYEYRLEDTSGGIIRGYQASTEFINVPAGDYIVRARDTNLCEDPIDAPVTVVGPETIVFTTTPTACYTGNNDGQIVVNVTAGNGDYQFRIDGGAWMNSNIATPTTYTFTGLANGSYDIEVKDGFGCPNAPNTQTVVLDANLIATIDVVDLSACADGSITVNTTGGDGNYAYAFVTNGTAVTPGDFGATNTFTVTTGNHGDYDVYVRDNNGVNPFCENQQTVTVDPATPLTFTATPTDPDCHDGTGNIAINITSGIAPYTYQIVDLDNGGASNETNTNVVNNTKTYFNLAPGNYTINVTDATGCTVTQTPVTINNPDELVADVDAIIPPNCSVDPNDFGFVFSNYPLTVGTLEFSDDGGATWQSSDTFTGYTPGQTVNPSIRTVSAGTTVCQTDFPELIIPYPLDDLNINVVPIVVNCTELQVTVQGTQGLAPYEYAYTEDPSTFNPATATWTAPTPGSHVWTGLIPGRTYVFYVRDASPCIRQSSVNVNDIITEPIQIDATYEPSCFGVNDAEITYTLTDSDGVFESLIRWELFDISGASVQTSGGNIAYNPTPSQDIVVTGLAPGEYYIVVTEVDGGGSDACISGSQNLIIDELDAITGTPNALRDITCSTPGLIEIPDISGGGGTYTYTLTSADFTAPITGTTDNPIEVPISQIITPNPLSVTVNVSVEDQFGCSENLGDVTLDISQPPTIDSFDIANCTSPSTLQINATSGAASILYSIDGGTTYFDNGGLFTNVAPATYNVSIIDSNGCTDTDTVTVEPILEANVSLTKLLECSGAPADAQITIDITAGSGNYDYEITNGLGSVVARQALPSDPLVAKVTVAETYTVTVYDNNTTAPECNRVFIIEVPAAVTPIFTESHTQITCNGANDGSITLVQTDNGINPLTYSISPVAGTFNAATNTFENLPPNTYEVIATGTNGCNSKIGGIHIFEPNPIVINAVAVTEFACALGNNSNNATITVDTTPANITGGSGTYVRYVFENTDTSTIEQDGTNSSYVETNILGGNYEIRVYDDNGCVGSITTAILPYDELQTATASITNTITCNPGNDGEITITVVSTANDTSKFEYSIDNGVTYLPSNVFAGLDVGTHNFLIRHTDTGCIITASETIVDPNNLHLDATKISDVICFGGNDGEMQFDLQDNTNTTYAGAITWTLWNTNGTPANLADDTSTTGSDTDGAFTIGTLTAGSYYIDVVQTPDPQCTYRASFTIAGPSAAIIAATDVTPITCAGNDSVISIINASGGWGGYTYYVGTSAPTGAGDYLANATFNNLAVGVYEAWVRDANGCEEMIQNNIALVDPTPISATLQINQENCTNLEGEIAVVGVAGGQGSNYTYQLIKDGTAFGAPQTTTTFSGLGEGSYTVEITDQWSCTFTTAAALLYEEINISSTVVKTIDCTVNPGGEITINTLGGSTNLEYVVTFPDGTTTITNATGVFTGLVQPGTYNFVVRDLDTTNPVCEKTISQILDDKVDPILLAATIQDVSCNGLSDGSITTNLDPNTNGNPLYEYNLYDSTGATLLAGPQSSPTFTGLAAAFYQVEVVSGRDCSVRQTVEVTEPTALLIDTTVIDFTCNPDNSKSVATITVNVVDGATTPGTPSGTSPYLYSIDNINFQTSNVFDIIDTGVTQNITVYVTDGNSCPATTPVTLEPLNVFTVSVTQNSAISCVAPEAVTITVTDNGNAANTYTYELLPIGNTAGTQTGTPTNTTATYDLTAVGGYVFRVTDTSTGCYVDTVQYDIAPYDLIDVVASAKTPVTCFGDANGEIEIEVTGYTGPYTYTVFAADGTPTGITGSSNTSANPFTIGGLSGGNYYVTVREDNAPECSEDSNIITIVSPDMPLTATVDPVANVTCDNNQGEIAVYPSGGYAPYDIQLTHTTSGQVYNAVDVSGNVFITLTAGTYDVLITDNNGCTITDTETLIAPTPIVAGITPPTTVLTCFGDTDGSVSATGVSGGEGVYQYQLNIYDATGATIVTTTGAQSSPTFNNLGAGIYTITVSDGWNCDVETIQAVISEPTDVSASLVEVSKLTCDDPAEILLTATGGTAPYEYSIDGTSYTVMSGGDNHSFSVGDGVYQYYVRDAFGCGGILSNQVSIDPVPTLAIDLDLSAAVINCNGESTASILATASGGLGNYSYELLDNPTSTTPLQTQSNGTFTGLAVGNYYIRVTSDGGCETVSPVVPITEPAPLQVDIEEYSNVSCEGQNDGTITVSVSGGTGTIKYAITPNLNQFDTKNVFTDLEPGVYDVIAQDENGCFIPFQFTINEPTAIVVDPTVVTDETCTGSEDGTVSVTITGGTAPYSTSLDSNDPNDYVLNQTDFTGLSSGQHVILVKDANGCDANVIVEIGMGVNLNATVTPVYECTGDTPSNYLDVVFEDPSVTPDVLYSLDSTDPAAMRLDADYTNITAGDHTLYITHANGCVNAIDFTIEGFVPLTLMVQNSNVNEITAVADGGKPNYTFYFDDHNNGSDNTFHINRTDTYTVRVVDENGCESVQDIYVEFIDIEIPNYFTPGGDLIHDKWKPKNTEGFPEMLTIIFDRYGREVYRMGADDEGWNGIYNSKELPSGDYWYSIKLRGENDDREFVGHFTLYR